MAHISTTCYWSAIVSVALSCTVFEIFDVEEYRDLVVNVKGHSRLLEMAPFARSDTSSY